MTCGLCFDQGDVTSTVKCLLTALESIKAHVLMLQKTTSDDAKTISILQSRNEKLHQALELKQKQTDLKNSQNFHIDKKRKLSLTKKTDIISPMPQSQNSLNMNIAINSAELSTSEDEQVEDEDETIAETESATKRTPRKLHRKLDVKNVENVQPINPSNWMGKTPQNQFVNKLSLTKRGSKLRQTRLEFKPDAQYPQEAIEDSPNLFTSLKQAKQSQTRSLLQKNDKDNDFDLDSNSNTIKAMGQNPDFFLEPADEEEMLKLSDQSILPPPATLPVMKCSNTSSDSLILMTPASQEIVFLDDSTDDISNLGTMDLMAEVIREDQSKALENYEKRMIEKQKHQIASTISPTTYAASNPCIKEEPQSQAGSDEGNESTKLPDEIEKYILDDLKNKEEQAITSTQMADTSFPRPLLIKPEKELTLKEKYNFDCDQCERLINFMGSNLDEKKIQDYLKRCRHQRNNALTPPGFWNPLMESLAADDPRNEVLIDTRFKKNQQQREQTSLKK